MASCGVAMLPWLGVLATSLPAATLASHWATAWVGLDALEALGLVTTGCLLRREDPRCCLAAAATAMLLVTDAWFDVTTAASGAGLATAVAMAACAELPMAVVCAVVAIRSLPRPAGRAIPQIGQPPAHSGIICASCPPGGYGERIAPSRRLGSATTTCGLTLRDRPSKGGGASIPAVAWGWPEQPEHM